MGAPFRHLRRDIENGILLAPDGAPSAEFKQNITGIEAKFLSRSVGVQEERRINTGVS
jgi:hypothetical protein